jgi:cob(I)alamin adenosyltransferase
MNTLQIISIVVSGTCGIITAVLAWVVIYRVNKTEVSFTGTPMDKKDCAVKMGEQKADIDKLFAKLGGMERGVEGRLNGKLDRIDEKIDTITAKMESDKTEILKIGEERTSATHDRINALVGEVGELRGRITQTHR